MAIFSKFFVGIIIVGFLLPRSMGGPGPNPNERSERIARIYNLMIEEFRRQRMQELAEAEAEAAAVAAAREFRRENSSNGGEESSDKDDSSSEGEDDRSSVLSTSDTEIDH
uniref:Uncharacterized protein n=1 Tax=Schizaphis graminum TaxID=13262 RepID=A0A2S2P9L4_SCHGA